MKRSLAILLAATFLWMLTQIPYDIIRQERIRAFGETAAPAQVVGKDLLRENGEARHLVSYRYHGPEGQQRRRTALFPAKAWNAMRIGQAITIYYATGEPNLSRASGEQEESFRVWLRRFARGDDLPEPPEARSQISE